MSEPRPPRPPGIQAILDELAAGPRFDSLDAVNRHLARRMREYNAQPQAELGGLSPVQMSQLLSGDWAVSGALRVADDVSLDELRHVPFLADARILMRYVAEHAPVKLTSTGNLSRAAVAELVPQLHMLRRLREEDEAALVDEEAARRFPIPPIRNEGDAAWLTVLRNVLLFAKLLVRRKGLILARRGQQLLDDHEAGALYALLFRTFFRDVDLRFLDNADDHVGLQQTIAWSFHQLARMADDWTSAESLAARAWRESARDPMSARDLEYGDMRHWAFDHRVLRPLAMFGLLEQRRVRGEDRWAPRVEYRRTPLFERVLRFELHG